MLISKPQVRIVSKLINLPTGELVNAFFAVINIEGSIEVKFLGFKEIKNSTEKTAQILLPEICQELKCAVEKSKPFTSLVSPFFNFKFLINQLARAPSIR